MPNESAPTPSFAIKADRFVLPGGLFGPGYLPVVEGTFGVFSTEAPEGREVVDRAHGSMLSRGSHVGPAGGPLVGGARVALVFGRLCHAKLPMLSCCHGIRAGQKTQ